MLNNTVMRAIGAFLISTMSAVVLSACEPCEVVAEVNGVIIKACPAPGHEAEDDGDEGRGSDSSGGNNSTGDNPTGGDGGESGESGGCDAPNPGTLWGPCHDDSTCDVVGGVELACTVIGGASVCLSPCQAGTCEWLPCGVWMCTAADLCVGTCSDDEPCPHPGMTCTPGGLCAWT